MLEMRAEKPGARRIEGGNQGCKAGNIAERAGRAKRDSRPRRR